MCISTAVDVPRQAPEVVMAGYKVIAAAVGIEVVEGVGQVAVDGAEVIGRDAATEAVASEVLDRAANAANTKILRDILRNDAAEGEHIGAGACYIAECSPVGIQLLSTCILDYLTESHTDIHGVALGVAARVD